ncbi:MAG: hypothetical protein Q4F75_05775 [Pseudomonadota bacterium]|nr:hypothetical protein [Pseudomonadota bacterium]
MKKSLYKSLALHLLVFIIFMIDLPLFWHRDDPFRQVPIIVDLNKVKISEMTNLPPKAKRGKEAKAASTIKRKIEDNYTQDKLKEKPAEEKKPEAKPDKKQEVQAADEKPEEPKDDYLVAPQPKKPKAPVKKKQEKFVPVQKPKPKPKQQPKPKADKTPELANPLKSLLASVDALEKNLGETSQEAVIEEDARVNNMGVEGGTQGSYFSELSISEIDAIAGRLRACWNLDPGAMGAQNMIVEIRAYLRQDGSVDQVDILDQSRYNSDTHFRSVADSARRAVYICAPYKIFAEKYADNYDMWKTMLLRFNPLDATIK